MQSRCYTTDYYYLLLYVILKPGIYHPFPKLLNWFKFNERIVGLYKRNKYFIVPSLMSCTLVQSRWDSQKFPKGHRNILECH